MAAAAAPLRRLLLRLRDPPPLPAIPLLTRLAPQIRRIPTPAPAPPLPDSAPSEMAPPSLRDALFSFHPGIQIRPCLDPIGEGDVNGGDAAERQEEAQAEDEQAQAAQAPEAPPPPDMSKSLEDGTSNQSLQCFSTW
ncbi:hypothetical protein EJB05_44061, partial [Eragrostis curvula]